MDQASSRAPTHTSQAQTGPIDGGMDREQRRRVSFLLVLCYPHDEPHNTHKHTWRRLSLFAFTVILLTRVVFTLVRVCVFCYEARDVGRKDQCKWLLEYLGQSFPLTTTVEP